MQIVKKWRFSMRNLLAICRQGGKYEAKTDKTGTGLDPV